MREVGRCLTSFMCLACWFQVVGGLMDGLGTRIECRFSTLWGRWMGFLHSARGGSARLGLTEPEGFGETRVERTPPKLNEYFESGSTFFRTGFEPSIPKSLPWDIGVRQIATRSS